MNIKLSTASTLALLVMIAGVSAQDTGVEVRATTFKNADIESSGGFVDLQFVLTRSNTTGEIKAKVRAVDDGKVNISTSCELVCYGSTCFRPSYCVGPRVPKRSSVLMTNKPFDLAFVVGDDKVTLIRDPTVVATTLEKSRKAAGGSLE